MKKKLGRKLLIIFLAISITLLDIGGNLWSSQAAAEGSIASDSEIASELVSSEPAATDIIDAPPADSAPGIVQEISDYILNGREIDPSEAPMQETEEERILAIKEKYAAATHSRALRGENGQRAAAARPVELTTEQIKELMIQGATIEDVYEVAFLAGGLEREPFDLYAQKKAYTGTWDEFRLSLQGGSIISVSESVYGKNDLEVNLEWPTVSYDVYSVTDITYGSDNLVLFKNLVVDAVTTLDMNVSRAINDFKMEIINQTAKPQFSDRSSSGEIIDPASGTLTWKDTQLSLPGRDGLDLNIGVMYNSSQATVFEPLFGNYNYSATKFDIGTGWSLTLPAIQTYGNDLYYHDGKGAIYQIQYEEGDHLLGYTHLKGYKGKDMRFMYDETGSFTSGGHTSNYYLEHADKTREYFGGMDNALLGIVDRYGNTISFTYGNVATASQIPKGVLKEITDSVGRKVKFEYDLMNNTYLPENTDSAEEKMTVTVVDPSGKEGQKVVYTRIRVGSEVHTVYPNGSFTRYWIGDPKPVLTSITYPNGEKVQFGYNKGYTIFNTNQKTFKPWDSYTGTQAYIRLNAVQYTHSKTKYEYADVLRNYGPNGAILNARVSARYDQVLKSGTFKDEYNRINFNESQSYDAYPAYHMEGNYPDTFSYAGISDQTDSLGNKVTSTTTFNGKGQLLSTEQQSSNKERIVEKNTSFHSVFTQSPTTSERWEYGPGDTDSTANKLYSETSYDGWGNVSSATRLMTDSQRNNPTLKARNTTAFAYEPTYRFLSSKSWYASEGSTVPLTESYTYTAQGRVQTARNAADEITSFAYEMSPDGKNRLYKATATKNSGGKTVSKSVVTYGPDTAYAYPTLEEAYSNIGTVNQQVVKKTTAYDMGTGRVSSVKDGSNQTTIYTYDALGRPTQITYPTFSNQDGQQYSVVEQYSYTPGQISGDFDTVNAGTHSLAVTSTKTVTRTSNGAKLTTSGKEFYDAFGHLLLEMVWDENNAKWVKTQYRYDSLGRPVYSKDEAANTLSVAYDTWGRQNLATDANGDQLVSNHSLKTRTSTSYLQEKRTGDKLNYVEMSYDPWGNKSSVATYRDWPNNQQRITETYSYDFTGNVVTYTDANGNKNDNNVTTLYTYDALGRLSAVKDALNQTTSYIYDGNNQLAKVTVQAKNGTPQTLNTKTYNELGLITQKQDGASQNETYTYNNLGQLSGNVDRNGSLFTYTYDESGQLKSSKISGTIGGVAQTLETKINFGDSGPQYRTVQTLTNNAVTAKQTQTVNSLNQVRSTTSVVGSYSTSIANVYDVLGRMTKIQDNLSSYTNYQYNKLQLQMVQTNGSTTPNTAATVNAQYIYYANSLVDTITYPTLADGSFLTTKNIYNKALGWVESVSNTKGSALISKYTYTYDNNGNIRTVSETLSAGAGGNGAVKTTSYGYDALNRVTSITRADGSSVSYTYDVRGNRQTASDTVASSMDMVDTSYTYDLLNTLRSVTSGASTTKFEYYADGLRYLKTNGTTSTRVNYNLNGQVISEEKLNGTTVVERSSYVRGDRLLAKKDKLNNKDYYYLYNGHGDVVQIVDTSGAVKNYYSYDAWGTITSQKEEVSNSFKYAGETYDAETGLYYLRARYYDPNIGRFLNEDTYEGQIDNPLSLNLYTYVGNNPLIRWDPSGNTWIGDQWSAFVIDMKSVHASWETAMGYWTMGFTDPFFTSAKVSMSSKEYWYAQAEVIFYSATMGRGTAGKQLIKQESKEVASVVRLVKNPCNCFIAGTKVQTDEGEKNIEDIEVGDMVLAKDENNPDGELAYKEVTNLYRNQRDDIIKLHVGEQVIETTDNHPFWVEGKGWVFADKLQVGDRLQKADRSNLTIDKVEFIELDDPVTVYNFTVADYHTYYVTGLGIWVHNTNCFDAASFEKKISRMNVNEKIGTIRTTASNIASQRGWAKDSKLTRINGRDVYYDSGSGNYYALDTQHGRFEVVNKRGKHQGEVNFNLDPTKAADTKGGHDLIMK